MVEVLRLSKMSSHSFTLCPQTHTADKTKDVLQPTLTGQPKMATPTHTVCVHSHSYMNAGVCFPAILPGDLFFTWCPTLSDSLHMAVPIFILHTHLSTSCLTYMTRLTPHHLIIVSAKDILRQHSSPPALCPTLALCPRVAICVVTPFSASLSVCVLLC